MALINGIIERCISYGYIAETCSGMAWSDVVALIGSLILILGIFPLIIIVVDWVDRK